MSAECTTPTVYTQSHTNTLLIWNFSVTYQSHSSVSKHYSNASPYETYNQEYNNDIKRGECPTCNIPHTNALRQVQSVNHIKTGK